MYPSKPNANAAGSNRDSDTSKFTAASLSLGKKHGLPMDSGYQSSNPSAPLLPSSPYNPPPPNMALPSYSSVVAQDSSDWKNRSPYLLGPGLAPGPTNQTPYPTGGLFSYGPPVQAPYRTGPDSGPEFAGNAPYPTGPGLESRITSQPAYYTGPSYISGPASQAPYPIAAMPMPALVNADRQMGVTVPVTIEPKSANLGHPPGGYGQGPVGMQTAPYPMNGNQQGLIHPTTVGKKKQYTRKSQYVPNQYVQLQPNTVYVVHKTEPNQSADDERCFWACCLAACYCLGEGLKASTSS